jgi:hypothetical protein
MNEDIIIQYSISLEDFQQILEDKYTQEQIIKIFNDDRIREIITKKLSYNEYTNDDLRDILNDYSGDFKNE